MEDNSLQIAEQLIQRAKKRESSEFEFIRSLEECFAAHAVRKAVKKVVKSFTTSRNNLYNVYVSAVNAGTDNIDVILAISELERVIEFYENEICIVSDMIDEYVSYVFSGHIWDTLIGNYRKEEDLVDFRKVEWHHGE